MSAAQFQAATGVADGVLAALGAHLALLGKWQARINLVGRASLADPWRRHVLDSAQLHPLIGPGATVLDLGSGAGFPGLVLAAMGGATVHLVDSDGRKCAFLGEAARAMGIAARVRIHDCRIEALAPFPADIVTARALAPLAALLGHARPFLKGGTRCLFPKGKKADDELTEAGKSWTMRVREIASLSDPSGTILRIDNIRSRP